MGVTDIFGMFDKVDDIILEPVKLVCDALHQPLKHLDAGIERKNKEQEHLLDVELQKLEFEIEERKKDNELNREIRRNSEIQRMQEEVKNSAFNRSKEVAEFYKQYQIDKPLDVQ